MQNIIRNPVFPNPYLCDYNLILLHLLELIILFNSNIKKNNKYLRETNQINNTNHSYGAEL